MKRIIVIFLLAALLLSGCAPKETVHTVTPNRNGIDYAFTVDTENRTISDGQYTYTYAVRGDTTTITYPNGAQFYWTQNGYLGAGGWDDHYDPKTYTDGDMLINVIDETTPEPKNGNFLAGLLLAALGARTTDTVTGETDYLLYGAVPGSKKIGEAVRHGVNMISEATFAEMLAGEHAGDAKEPL